MAAKRKLGLGQYAIWRCQPQYNPTFRRVGQVEVPGDTYTWAIRKAVEEGMGADGDLLFVEPIGEEPTPKFPRTGGVGRVGIDYEMKIDVKKV